MKEFQEREHQDDVLGRAGEHLMRRSAEYREMPVHDANGKFSFSRGARRAVLIAGFTVAAVATTLVMSSGSGSPAMAWSPIPAVATNVDQEAARAACTSDLPEGLPDLSMMEVTVMDVRGSGALAVFSDTTWTLSCMLRRDGDDFERGPVIAEELTVTESNGDLELRGIASTLWPDGTSTSMINGVVPSGAVSIQLEISGEFTAEASVNNGRFAIWWIGAYDETTTGTVRAFDASGVEVASIPLESAAVEKERGR